MTITHKKSIPSVEGLLTPASLQLPSAGAAPSQESPSWASSASWPGAVALAPLPAALPAALPAYEPYQRKETIIFTSPPETYIEATATIQKMIGT